MACGARSKPNDHDVPHCRELEPTEAEAPMHPDMIRAELQKAMAEGYAVTARLVDEVQFDDGTVITHVQGTVDGMGENPNGREWVTIGSNWGKNIYIEFLQSVERIDIQEGDK
jgi:hypothetical protein